MSKKKYLKITIKGVEWTVFSQSTKSYKRLHGIDSIAITYPKDREIYFDADRLIPDTVFHELLHGFVDSSNITSSNLTPSQMEELCCEIIGEHYYDMGLLANKIMGFILK